MSNTDPQADFPNGLPFVPQRSLGERIVQAARLAAALHLVQDAEQGLHGSVAIGKTGPVLRRESGPQRSLAA